VADISSAPEVHITDAGLIGSCRVSIRTTTDDSARGGMLVVMNVDLEALPAAISAAVERYRSRSPKVHV
jgi:hypothetical protein